MSLDVHGGGSGPWEQGLLGSAHAIRAPIRLGLAPWRGSRPLTLVPWASARFSACPGHPWVSTLPRASQKDPLSPREGLLIVSVPHPPHPTTRAAVQALSSRSSGVRCLSHIFLRVNLGVQGVSCAYEGNFSVFCISDWLLLACRTVAGFYMLIWY